MDREIGRVGDYWATESAQKNAASTFGPTQQGEQTAPRQIGLGDRLDETLKQLGNALEMVHVVEDRIFGPSPRAVSQDKEASQPHVAQYAELLQGRAMELTQRINRIAAAL